jgi:hypothetical protein
MAAKTGSFGSSVFLHRTGRTGLARSSVIGGKVGSTGSLRALCAVYRKDDGPAQRLPVTKKVWRQTQDCEALNELLFIRLYAAAGRHPIEKEQAKCLASHNGFGRSDEAGAWSP